jgi:hypothetical protein
MVALEKSPSARDACHDPRVGSPGSRGGVQPSKARQRPDARADRLRSTSVAEPDCTFAPVLSRLRDVTDIVLLALVALQKAGDLLPRQGISHWPGAMSGHSGEKRTKKVIPD